MKIKLPILAILMSLSLSLVACNNSTNKTSNSNNNANTATTDNSATNENNTSSNSVYKTENFEIKDADKALEQLKSGNERFVNDKSELINVTKQRRDQLASWQNPYAVVVSCSDSRVTPNIVFNAGLGEIFDIRLAGNVVDDAIHKNVTNVVNEIKQDPIIKKLINAGKVKVVEAYYSFDGKVQFK